jgi:hypothetical protein
MFAVAIAGHPLLILAGVAFVVLAVIWHLGSMTSAILLGIGAGWGVYKLVALVGASTVTTVLIGCAAGAGVILGSAFCLMFLSAMVSDMKSRRRPRYPWMQVAKLAALLSGPAFAGSWLAWTIIAESKPPIGTIEQGFYVVLGGVVFAGFAFLRWRYLINSLLKEEIDAPTERPRLSRR